MTKDEAKAWMFANVHDYRDRVTGEVNATSLAEACADHFDCDEVLDDQDHWIWEIAIDHFELLN